ncbi:uncharacterized protein LOC123315470 [Coccinella septempunctata]|uniref:uncharacterized protein LOC123315470 n=1 Tax=Coccinella septempunctata TaxID=41139 RepID=UPI001D067B43|nr:uncharacterized protein LOC123315470 [Coccinella septempunctata]
MNSLNIGWWNSTKLHTFKIYNLEENDVVETAKLKIMKMLHISDEEKLELIYRGVIMKNFEKISNYIKDNKSLIFMIKMEDIHTRTENYPKKDLQKIFEKYNEAYLQPGFKEIILRVIKRETITDLLDAIPELSEDLVALSIIKDISLFETILKPSVMKDQLKKHPTLLMSVDYLIREVIKNTNGRLRSSVHLTDEDYSESDDIEIDFDTPNVSGFNHNNIPLFSFSDDGGIVGTLIHSNIFEDVLMDVLDDQRDEGGQALENNPSSLSTQLHQMHELGLFDDLLNFRALQIAGGNVQHAVDLILNRIIE